MTQWSKLTSTSATELVEQAGLDESARKLLTADMRPEAYLDRLQEEALWPEAIAIMTRALPLREAIGWASLCDRSTTPQDDDPRHAALLAAVEHYIREPTDERGRAALERAQSEPDGSAGQMLATAAGFSGGTIQVGDNPPVPIPVETIPPMIAGAVMVAATRVEPTDIEDTYRVFLQRAVDIAAGGSWRLPGDDSGHDES